MWPAIMSFLKPVFGIIDQAVEDKDEANRIKAEIQRQILDNRAAEMKSATEIIVAEAQGESWLQRNWRPILMLSIVAIVVNNYLLVPWAGTFGFDAPVLELPDSLFNLMTVGVGGYVVGRSGEKISRNLKISKES